MCSKVASVVLASYSVHASAFVAYRRSRRPRLGAVCSRLAPHRARSTQNIRSHARNMSPKSIGWELAKETREAAGDDQEESTPISSTRSG